VVNKEQSVYNESLLAYQAEREKCSQSTFSERKIMKTAFKRVALVAAAALAIGGISAVSAQAVGAADWTITNANAVGTPVVAATSTETATQIAGVANFVTLQSTATGTNSTYFTVTGGTTTTGTTSGTVASAGLVSIATPTVGTITVTSYLITGGAAATTATTTTTISVIASVAGTVYGGQTVYASDSTLSGVTYTPVTPSSITDAAYTAVTAPASSPYVASFSVLENDGASTPTALTAGYKAITASVTNGLISATGGGITPLGNTTYASATPVNNTPVVFVLSGIAGLAGTSTLTLSVNGVVVKTYTATFTGAAVKLVVTAVNPVIAIGTAPVTNITANTNALEVQEFDANGNAVAVQTGSITFTVGTTTVASVAAGFDTAGVNYLGGGTSGTKTSTSAAGVSLNGLVAGTTTITAADSVGTLTSAPVSVRVSSGVPTSVVFTTDAASYAAGAAGTLTTTVSDAAGTLPAGTYTVFTAGSVVSSYALAVGALDALATVTVNDSGVATTAFNAPISDAAAVTISATAPASSTIVITPATFSVSSGSSDAANAATDAANEATDAANAATDAANAAADSADAATQAAQDAGDKADAALAAVTALSQQVTTLLAKVAALASTIAKIAKKVKA
jgi:hypothetical protein